jgi:uncharacterized protein YoaH (UPF0181 family)
MPNFSLGSVDTTVGLTETIGKGESAMSQLLIDLSDDERELVELRASSNGFPNPSAYVADLLRRDCDADCNGVDLETAKVADELRAKASALKARDPAEYDRQVAKMHQMIRDGINSGPAIEMTDAEWDSLWREADERFARGEAP